MELAEDRWHELLEFREKEIPETIDIRIHDPTKSEILIEVTGPLNSQPACDRSRREIPRKEKSIVGKSTFVKSRKLKAKSF